MRVLVVAASCFLALLSAADARAVSVASAPTTMLPDGAEFSSIVNCSPLNLLIQPSRGDAAAAYSLDAHPAVVPTIDPGTGALHLGVRAFNASTPITLRVALPADKLSRVATSSGAVTVAPGFNSSTLSLVNTGAATLYVSGLANNASHVSISLSGPGAVVVDAVIASASVEGESSGAAFIRGVSRTVAVDLGGLARAAIEPATPTALIRGTTAGMASVQLTRGRCAVESDTGGFFGPPCAPVPAPVRLPPPVVTWSCGLAVAVDGVLGCDATAGRNAVVVSGGRAGGGGGGGGVVTTTTNGGGGANFISTSTTGGSSFMTSTSSGGGGGGTFVSSGTGGGNGGGVFMSSSSGGGGGGGNTVVGGNGAFYTIRDDGSIVQAPVFRAPACTATAEEMKMTLA